VLTEKPVSTSHRSIVSAYLKAWPRAVFDLRRKGQLLEELSKLLAKPGVYVLYRDDEPYYIGKTTRRLLDRLYDHANRPGERYYNFWNVFSAFVVENPRHIPEVEGILIAAFPTQNSAKPRLRELRVPTRIGRQLHRARLFEWAGSSRTWTGHQ
jgi:hypothetical protein